MPQKKKSVDERVKETQDRIDAYTKRIQQLQFEISSYQDLISDLRSDLQMMRSHKGGNLGSKEKEKEEEG